MTTSPLVSGALRINLSDLDEAIFKVRRLHLAGKDASGWALRYAERVRRCHELREAGLALHCTGPLFDELAPTPYRDQLVGYTAEQRKALEWKGVFDRFPFPARHHQFLQAAE